MREVIKEASEAADKITTFIVKYLVLIDVQPTFSDVIDN